MKEFLTNVRPPKFLRYFFYIGYSWYRGFKSERDDAHFTIILLFWFAHTSLFFTIFLLLYESVIVHSKYLVVLPFAIFFGYVFYLLFWYDNKWKLYIKEFSHLKKKDRLLGSIYLFIYLFTCLFVGFYDLFIY